MAKDRAQKARQLVLKRMKKSAKARLRAKTRPAYIPPTKRKKIDREFPAEEYMFWLCHGANHLASDYEEGVWDPLFPEIYEGTLVDPEEISRRVQDRFKIDFAGDTASWGGKARMTVAWTVQSQEIVFLYAKEMWRHLGDDAEARIKAKQPHVPAVWKMFADVGATFTS